jgi:hypothetical protein
LRTDVGGFGVGSDLTWQTILGVGWGFTESGQLDLGWRFLDVDYDGNFAFDAQYSGPMLGLIWTF